MTAGYLFIALPINVSPCSSFFTVCCMSASASSMPRVICARCGSQTRCGVNSSRSSLSQWNGGHLSSQGRGRHDDANSDLQKSMALHQVLGHLLGVIWAVGSDLSADRKSVV